MTLTVRDIANLLSVSEKTVYRWINQGILPAYQVHEQYRFNRAEILEWATSRKIPISPEIFAEPETNGVQMPSLFEALQHGGISYRVIGADKWAVLKNVVQLLQLPEEVDREFLLKVLVAREELSSTGVGEGIAIPHVRNPVVLHVSKPMVTLFFLEHPIDFRAIDGQPVFALFMLISPTVRAHLHLISHLAYALRDPAFRAVIERRGLRDEILQAAQKVEEGLMRSDNSSKQAK
jgi:nitrogen PTS system EIIA component